MNPENKKIVWHNEKRKISDLIPAEYNPRQLTKKQTEDLSKSLQRFALADPIIVNYDNHIIGGHQRINVLKMHGNGGDVVDVRVPSRQLTFEEEQELNLRLNKNLGEWDINLLANFDDDLLKDVGFDSKELDRIFQLGEVEGEDNVPEIKKETIAKKGEVYQLGCHRIMCGDSTSASDVSFLMDGQDNAEMVFTSPPYNIGSNALGDNKNLTKQKYLNDDDDKSQTEYFEILKSFLNIHQRVSQYQFLNIQSVSGNKIAIIDLLNEFKNHFVDVAIWNKGGGCPAMQESVLNSRFEFIFIFSSDANPTRQIKTNKFSNISNVFDLNPSRKNEFSKVHAATFPVALAEYFILIGSPRDGIVIDSFLGTGSTLIACEKTKRMCRGMEIDPQYVDVAIERWEKFTGQKAVKLNG